MAEKRIDNRTFTEVNEEFRRACIKAGTPATKRQASKFRMGKGWAYKNRNRKDLL